MPKNVCQWDRFSGNRTRSLRVHHTTLITWVKAVEKLLPEAYNPEVLPEVAELDELETFVCSKKLAPGHGQRLTTSRLEF